MSCQSLATRAFTDTDEKMTHCNTTTFQRSVRFSSESRSSTRNSNDAAKKESSGCMSMSTLTPTPMSSTPPAMSQSAPPASTTFDLDETPSPPSACRFPKLEECAHFHYERVSLGGLRVDTLPADTPAPADGEGWICLKVRSHVNQSPEECEARALNASWSEASEVSEWTLSRNRENLLRLDDMLHRCIYDRKVSGLPDLSAGLTPALGEAAYRRLIADYMHHLSIIADDSINCGPVLNWLQMDNKGHKLLVANEDSSSINTPAVAAAYSVRKYVSQARDEISFEVGDMISIIDMPGPNESQWWRGKRGFRVGFFPHQCVAVIGDKVPRNMTQPPPIVGSVAVAPIKPVLRKHGKLISLFRSFILSRPSRRSLKQQGILRERVFGCDLGEHLLNSGYDVPLVLVECARVIESRGAVDGVYRLSGGSGLTQRLRAAIDAGHTLPATPDLARDPHAVPSLLKMYFRELPNPLCTYQLYESFVSAMQEPDEGAKLRAVRQTVVKLPPPHYRTLSYLMRHLRRVSLLGAVTGMTPRNMAIVWAPNLLRAPRPHHALQGVAVQAVVTEFLICYAEELFSQEQGADSGPESIEQESDSQVELRGSDTSGRRPKSLPVNPPTKLLSLEEARRRGGAACGAAPALPVCGTIAAAAADTTQLRPSASHKPKYIEVGSGPDNLPQYHTVLELPLNGHKRGVKRSPSGWRGLFSRSKHRARTQPPPTPPPAPPADEAMASPVSALRPVKSCESLASDSDTLPPLARRPPAALKQHTRSSSVDSYFEPWVSELAAMRLRLAPQERDHHMFSEEDDTHALQGDSLCSTPPESGLCSVEPSPRKNLHVDIEAAAELAQSRLVLDTAAASLRFIDGESPRAPPEKRHSNRPPSPHNTDIAKRLCKDRKSNGPLVTDFPVASASVKLRERHSPKKSKNRYSGLHTNELIDKPSLCRLSWPNKDGHSTLIKIDWPIENSVSNLTTSTLNSSPVTPVTPAYDQLETDSEISDSNKHTIKINSTDCLNCNEATCLKCELKAADYENVSPEASLVASEISYQNLNRLSAVSSSSDDKKDVKVMTSSHESSSTYSNSHDDYECYNFSRPSYINLNTSSSKSSPSSPMKSPLKSTISITFKPSIKDDTDSLYEDVNVDKSLSIVEDASIPQTDASLPTQNACQPDFNNDLIILESPTDNAEVIDPDTIDSEDIYNKENNTDVYSQVKFFKKSIEEVNAMILELPENQNVDMPYQSIASGDIFEQPQSDMCFDSQIKKDLERHYENINFDSNDYANINVDTLNLCDKLEIKEELPENGNIVKEKNLNVRELAIRFESPTEAKGPFTFEKFKTEIKYPSLERKDNATTVEVKDDPNSPKSYKLTKNSTRSLDESAFIKEFGPNSDRRKSFEVKKPDLNLNLNLNTSTDHKQEITPTTENKISLIQRFNEKPIDIKQILNFDTEKKLSRERIEKYKEERRLFLREKYSSQSFRSNPEQLTRIKIKKEKEDEKPFERRNTVDLGQRMRFSLAKSANNLDIIQSPAQAECDVDDGRFYERKEKTSPSYNIKDMTALFEQKNQNGTS